jgi:hypothetical protein
VLLPKSLLDIGRLSDRYDAVKSIVLSAIEDGTFTYTELMLSDEALYTTAFMVMDGTVMDSGGVPRAGALEVIPSGPLRLVCIDTPEKVEADNAGLAPHQHRKLFTIRDGIWHAPRIPGSSIRGDRVKRTVDYGMDAMIDDSLDSGRQARASGDGWRRPQKRAVPRPRTRRSATCMSSSRRGSTPRHHPRPNRPNARPPRALEHPHDHDRNPDR